MVDTLPNIDHNDSVMKKSMKVFIVIFQLTMLILSITWIIFDAVYHQDIINDSIQVTINWQKTEGFLWWFMKFWSTFGYYWWPVWPMIALYFYPDKLQALKSCYIIFLSYYMEN